jgi:hypothetical protein
MALCAVHLAREAGEVATRSVAGEGAARGTLLFFQIFSMTLQYDAICEKRRALAMRVANRDYIAGIIRRAASALVTPLA